MKILYAIQGTGNGHVSRAVQIYPHLQKFGDVDFFLSGCNYSMNFPMPIKYKSKGISLHYSKCGGLNYMDIIKKASPTRVWKEAMDLPVDKYDYVINDFECITALACGLKKIPSVQFGHQASFQSVHTPRPEKQNYVGEWILKNFARSSKYIGLHFDSYDENIFSPVIKKEIQEQEPENHGHVTVYLPAYQKHCLIDHFHTLKDIHFHWFLPNITNPVKEKNITYYPVNQEMFNNSLINCHGIITGGGFETPAEALYLGKKLMSIPIQKHYEQQCNGAALKKLGIKVKDDLGEDFSSEISEWFQKKESRIPLKANNIPETLHFLLDNYPFKKQEYTAPLFI